MNDSSNNIFLSDGQNAATSGKLTHGSLFSGIGGFDLAAEWMGWENEFHCEWNEFGKKILKYYWPKAISYDDITKTDFSIWRGKIDILTGGFPCQPYSVAGKRKGAEDDRHLWPEMLRAIREIQPSWIVGENVSGLISWDGGMVFEEVQTDLENEGYEVWANVLPAASVNAPHKRDRVWFVAFNSKCNASSKHNSRKSKETRLEMEGSELGRCQRSEKEHEFNTSNTNGDASFSCCERCNNGSNNRQERQVCDNENRNAEEDKSKRNGRKCRIGEVGEIGNATNSESKSSRRKHEQRSGKRKLGRCNCKNDAPNTKCKRGGEVLQNIQSEKSNGNSTYAFNEPNDWKEFPTQAPICDGDDGLSSRLDFITFPKWRAESVKGGGNAIVPQVALQIFKAIDEFRSSGA